MKEKNALIAIFLISLFGLIFSGVLSYQELFGGIGPSCPSVGTPGTVFGYPACVYGFSMYLILVIISGLSVFKKHEEQ